MEMAIIYSGDFVTEENKLTLRTLTKSLISVQRGLDRAAIYNQNQRIWKYAKLNPNEYSSNDFYFSSEAGSFRAILTTITDQGRASVQLVRNNLFDIYQRINNDAAINLSTLKEDYENRLIQLQRPNFFASDYTELLTNEELIDRYVSRSIAKEFDQVLSTIRQESAGESVIEVQFIINGRIERYIFDKNLSQRFHNFISRKELDRPVSYMGLIFEMNSNSKTARIEHLEQSEDLPGKSLIKFKNQEDYDVFNDTVRTKQIASFIGCPILEAGGHDPISGDIMYLFGVQRLSEEVD